MLKYGKCKECGVAFKENGKWKFEHRINKHFREFHSEIFTKMMQQRKKAFERLRQLRLQLESEYQYILVGNNSIRHNLPMQILTKEQYKGEPKKKR